MYILFPLPLVCPSCKQMRFTRFGAEKDLSDMVLTAGKTKSRPKTFQTPENTILSFSETDSVDKIFMAS